MKLNFFANCTEALVPNGLPTEEEIHITVPRDRFFGLVRDWVLLTPPVNRWRVRRVIETCCNGGCGFTYDVIYVEYYKDEEWHRLWREHVEGITWPNLWGCVRTTIRVCRESMPEVISWERENNL